MPTEKDNFPAESEYQNYNSDDVIRRIVEFEVVEDEKKLGKFAWDA